MDEGINTLDNEGLKLYYKLNQENIILNENLFDGKEVFEIRKILILIIKEINSDHDDINGFVFRFSRESSIKEPLIDIVSENNPLLRISRLLDGDDLANFSFGGIKNINDLYGDKSSIDRCLDKVKKEIQKRFDANSSSYFSRLIRKNYKQLTIAYKNNNISPSKEELIKFLGISKEEIAEFLDEILKGEDNVLIDLFKEYFSISLGSSVVEGTELQDKLLAFYSSEVNAKMDSDDFDFWELYKKSNEILTQESELKNLYSNTTFKLLGVVHKVFVKNNNTFGGLNPVLIESVRKNEDIGNKDLFLKVDKYIESLNIFDFIAPYINGTSDFIHISDDINYLEDGIKDGIIGLESVERNYKGTLTRTALIEYSKGKQGLRVFVDIAGMGIMNYSEFRDLANKIANGEITEDNKSILLSSGMHTTIKFKNFVDTIQKKYPNISLSLGGDEVFIFVPDSENIDREGLLNSIGDSFEKEGLSGRTTYSYDHKNQESLYNDLDNISFISKKIEKILRKFTPVFSEMPSLIKVDIPDDIRSYIVGKSGEYEKNLMTFLYSFEEKILSDSLLSSEVNNLRNEVSEDIIYILGDETQLFTFLPEGNSVVKHNYYFQRTNGIIQIRISQV